MPPKRNLSGQPHPADEAWRNPPPSRYYGNRPPVGSMPSQGSGFKKGSDNAGAMKMQQQRTDHEPHQQRLVPQRAGIKLAQV